MFPDRDYVRALLFGSGRSWRWMSVLGICRAGGVGAAGGVNTGTLKHGPRAADARDTAHVTEMMHFHKQMPCIFINKCLSMRMLHRMEMRTSESRGMAAKRNTCLGIASPRRRQLGAALRGHRGVWSQTGPPGHWWKPSVAGRARGGMFPLVPPSMGSGAMPYLYTLSHWPSYTNT